MTAQQYLDLLRLVFWLGVIIGHDAEAFPDSLAAELRRLVTLPH